MTLSTMPVGSMSPVTDSAMSQIVNDFSSYGLGNLAQFIYNEITSGVPDQQILLDVRGTPEYKARFPAMAALAQKGQAITEGQYINYETNVQQLFRSVGLPPGFHDQPDDIAAFLTNNVSISELTSRVQDGFQKVTQTDPNVRAYYAQHFGASGDAAIAATFLDPNRALPALQQMSAAAQFGGAGLSQGFNVSTDTANLAAENGISASQAQSGFGQLNKLDPYLTNTISEQGQLSPDTGAQAVFGLSGQAASLLQQRQDERQAAFGGSVRGGGAVGSTSTGLGTASQHPGQQ